MPGLFSVGRIRGGADSWLNMSAWLTYLIALSLTALAASIQHGLYSLGDSVTRFAVFYPVVLLATVVGGRWPGLLALTLSGLVSTFLWLDPINQLALNQVTAVNVIVFVATGLVIFTAALKLRQVLLRLRESEVRLSLAQTAGRIGVWDWNLETGKVWWSPVFYDITGIPADHSPDTAYFIEQIHPEDRQEAEAAFGQARTGLDRLDAEFRFVRPNDGGLVWLSGRAEVFRNADGRPTRVTGVSFDVSKRRIAEQAAVERVSELQAILDAVPAAVWIARDPTSQVITGNHRASALLRMEAGANLSKSAPENVSGTSHFRILDKHGRELQPHQLPVQRAASGETVKDFEEYVVFDDGSELALIGNAVPLIDGAGQVRGAVAAFVDITSVKQIETELRDLTGQLEERVAKEVEKREAALTHLQEAKRLDTIGRMTGGIAHDLNNLLTPIIGSLDLLQRSSLTMERSARLLDGALKAAERARDLVNRLLTFGRRQTLDTRKVHLGELVHGLSDLLQRTLSPTIRLVIEVPEKLPAAVLDPQQLELAVLNLAVNARDAMPDGGVLTISVDEQAVLEESPAHVRPGNYLRIAVEDTGLGMDERSLGKCLEPFFTTKGADKGTGLGLPMAHGFAEQSGGKLLITSVPGMGTRVEILLPATSEVLSISTADPPSALEIAGRCGTVLLVDDEALVRTGLAAMLSEAGYTVIEADTGRAAVDLIAKHREIDVLVTDYLMPGMNGAELAALATSARPDLPILVVTGYSQDGHGLPSHLPRVAKPLRQRELIEAVENARTAYTSVVSLSSKQ